MTIRVDAQATSTVVSAKCAPTAAPAVCTAPTTAPPVCPAGSAPAPTDVTAGTPRGELCFCTYNLDLTVGDTIFIRDYVTYCDSNLRGQPVVGWDLIAFTYTGFGANDPTVPANWHLADFNANLAVTVTSADAQATGNHGQVRSNHPIVVKSYPLTCRV